MELELENLSLYCFEYDVTNGVFFNKKNKSDFYVSRELVTISSYLERNSIHYEVDKDNNIIINLKQQAN